MQYKWTFHDIVKLEDIAMLQRIFNRVRPSVGAFDTETTGLHTRLDKPFLYQFGFLDEQNKLGFSFLVDLERHPKVGYQTIKAWYQMAGGLRYLAAHNVKFDLHMLANMGVPYPHDNLTDTMIYIRLAHDALQASEGGPPLGLKDYATRYIDPTARNHDRKIREWRSGQAKIYNQRLREMSLHLPAPEGMPYKSWTLAAYKDFFKDVLAQPEDLPPAVFQVYDAWRKTLPPYLQEISGTLSGEAVSYRDVDRPLLYKYGHYDIVYALEIFSSLEPIVHSRKQSEGLHIEESIIRPLWEMERVGFQMNTQYIFDSEERVADYIRKRRQDLQQLAGGQLTCGQHALIKKILEDRYQVSVPSTGAEQLDQISTTLKRTGESPDAVNFIDTIQELRTLEKWYSTYLLRFIREMKKTDRIYTTINQVGTVSGRVTSDFQQFPKGAIKDQEGNELFHPRKMIQVSPGADKCIAYIDYSQIELRVQALYTILLNAPDLNLCRAYMPYKCLNKRGELFEPTNAEHIRSWNEEWFLEEDPSLRWEPVDVHGATTTAATGLKPGDPGFSKLRAEIGKRVNFAKNYGATFNRIKQMFPDKSDEEVHVIDDAYYKAFPGVKEYQKYCYDIAGRQGYATNLFGIRYYGVSGHKLINMLIQGSSAYLLKEKIREIYDLSKKYSWPIQFQMNIHDELSWELNTQNIWLLDRVKAVMEDWPDAPVPIVADGEVTYTTWAEKEEVKSFASLYTCTRSVG